MAAYALRKFYAQKINVSCKFYVIFFFNSRETATELCVSTVILNIILFNMLLLLVRSRIMVAELD